MGQVKYVKLNPKASIFFDQASGIKVIRNEVVELTEAQLKIKSVRGALANGYLKEVSVEEASKFKEVSKPKEENIKEPKLDVESIRSKWDSMVAEGNDPEKLKEAFTLKELKALAISMDIEPEEDDTKMDLVVAMLDDQAESDEE